MRRSLLLHRPSRATFNPFDTNLYPTAAHGLWAEDLTSIADGAAVQTWTNRSGGGDPTQALSGQRPVRRAATSGLNGRASVEFSSGSSQFLDVDIADIAQSFTVLYVAKHKSTGAAQRVLGRGASATSQGVGVSSGAAWQQSWGISQTTGTADTNGHVFRFTANDSSSTIGVDGTTLATGAASTGGLPRLTVGAGYDGIITFNFYLDAYLAFLAVYSGNPSTATLEAALKTYYGI